jgi:hypothetical protein
VDSLAATLSRAEAGGRGSRTGWRDVAALTQQVQRELGAQLQAIRGILTAQQWQRLPEAVRSPTRQLIPPRKVGGAAVE